MSVAIGLTGIAHSYVSVVATVIFLRAVSLFACNVVLERTVDEGDEASPARGAPSALDAPMVRA